jgi:mannose-6-phosphate isomerase-like protein (cupin superfamily)
MHGMAAVDPTGIIVTPADGDVIAARENRESVVLVEREDVTISWFRLGPGEEGPQPHIHREHSDAFYVLAGDATFILGPDRERVQVGAGGLLVAPPNVVHTFGNPEGGETRLLNIHAPDGGFAAYMRASRDGEENPTFDSYDPPEDGGRPLADAIVSGPGDGERAVDGNRVATLKAVLDDFCLFEFEIDGPRGGPGVHSHDDQVDSFYVLEGEMEFTLGDAQYTAGPDTLVSVPRQVDHTFAHPAEGRARLLNIHAPDAGFAAFLRGAG